MDPGTGTLERLWSRTERNSSRTGPQAILYSNIGDGQGVGPMQSPSVQRATRSDDAETEWWQLASINANGMRYARHARTLSSYTFSLVSGQGCVLSHTHEKKTRLPV